MDLGLKGKVAVVTGGTSGIGKAIVNVLLTEGCKVIVCGRDREKGKRLQEECMEQGYTVAFEIADVSKYAELERFSNKIIEEYSKFDIWINNAGVSPKHTLVEMTEEEWDTLIDANLKSVFLGSKFAAKHMREHGGGVILNAASFASFLPSVGYGAYAATKVAIISLTKSLAAELSPFGIRAVSYVPGVIETKMTGQAIQDNRSRMLEDIALNKFGTPDDVANAVAFMASDKASYITGTHIEISGGKFCVQNPGDAWKGVQ